MNLKDNNHLDFLKSVPIFKGLDEKELEIVLECLVPKEVDENEMVFARLEKEKVLYIVRYGKLRLEMIGHDDKFFEKGDVFGEVAVINNNYRSGSIKALEPSLLISLNGNDLLNEDKIPAKTAIKIFIHLARMISSYLATAQNTSTQSLIEEGENEFVEFKSTLRYNLFTKKFDKEIEHAALKTVAAFLNTSGGTLICGVDDQKQILGLKEDNFKDNDHMMLHLTKLIQERIGMQHTRFIKSNIESSDGKKVLRVDVKPASSPAYLMHNNDEVFYVRTGPATSQMRVSEIYDYIQSRFQ
jgi:CRP-like cAMP-binding protein